MNLYQIVFHVGLFACIGQSTQNQPASMLSGWHGSLRNPAEAEPPNPTNPIPPVPVHIPTHRGRLTADRGRLSKQRVSLQPCHRGDVVRSRTVLATPNLKDLHHSTPE